MNICEQTWRTFHIADSPYLLKRRPIPRLYQKIEFLNNFMSMTLTPFYQNQKNQLHVGFISLSSVDLKQNTYFYNFFQKHKSPIYIQQRSSSLFDRIPIKMESVSTNKKELLSPLIDSERRHELIDKLGLQGFESVLFYKREDLNFLAEDERNLDFLTQKVYVRKKTRNLNKKDSFLIKIVFQDPSMKKLTRLKKTKKFKKWEVRNLFKKAQFRKTMQKFSRKLFYKREYKVLDPEIEPIPLKQICPKLIEILNPIIVDVIKNDLSYLDILELTHKTEIPYSNLNLRPRLLSGYKYPDFQEKKILEFFSKRSLKINTNFPAKYRSFFINSFLKTLKKQKQKNITYPFSRRFATQKKLAEVERYQKKISSTKELSSRFPDWMYKLTVKFPGKKKPRFKRRPFYESHEPVQPYSWLVISKWGFCALWFKLFQALYQKYGREMVLALANLIGFFGLVGDEEWWKQELGLEYAESYRGIRKVRKYFEQTAGIETLVASLSSTLWYLKSRNILFSRLLSFFYPQSKKNRISYLLQPVLLVGPPGTGKTFLVQTLAGETGLPVLLQSGSVLKSYRYRGRGKLISKGSRNFSLYCFY